ncbi:uncharacterized protein [Canis lupus baileyi]|uniref:uncharacterized protein LOC111094883 n=1 Tax=Canis lupus familiaris TaxID=9615 RepID=UPI000BAA084F|nr:uncharacterized protein LOC111094883 [Canis lupus familiaris]XP_038305146.1 uncharacterized protein LOC111094883 [Canis lupus familiaris]|eukprot:XP_022272023.1 uncharacterized protein LOC111094883 [Canis lupus familiaris]
MSQFQKHNKDGMVHTRLNTGQNALVRLYLLHYPSGRGRRREFGGRGGGGAGASCCGEPEGPGVESAGRPAGVRTDGGANRSRTLPSPRLLPREVVAAPKPRRGQGRHVTLDLVHSSSSGKPITKAWPLPPLAHDGVQPERPAPLGTPRRMPRKPHSVLQQESPLQVGFLPFTENAQTDLAAHPGASGTFWKLRSPRFTIQPDPSCVMAPTAMRLSTFNGLQHIECLDQVPNWRK